MRFEISIQSQHMHDFLIKRFVIEMTGDKMSICVCVHSQAAIWLTAEI